jgi:putative transposase
MKKTLRYNYRLNPTAPHSAKFVEFGASARGVWNLFLSENMRRYDYDKTFLFYNDMTSLLVELKQFEEFAWLKALDSAAAQQVLRDLDTALKNACSKGRLQRFPKHKVSYKIKKQHNDSFRCVNNSNCIRVEKGTISLPKIGKVDIVLHRALISKIKTATVQLRHGKWEISLTQEVNCEPEKQQLQSIKGYDINSVNAVVSSEGDYITNPKFFKQSKIKMGQLQAQLARRIKGSGRWHKTKQRINALHGKISRQRLAFAHEVSRQITNDSDIAVFEDLNVKGMQQFNGNMVNDNIMGTISGLVRYKSQLAGKLHHEINRFTKSSGICYECKHGHKFGLATRTFTCESCGTQQCRDVSAAISVANTGEKELIAAGIVARVIPIAQKKASIKTKVFERVSKLSAGTEKKEAA